MMNTEFQTKRLYRDTKRSTISGVCAGIARYLNVDAVWVRLVAVLALFFMPVGAVLAYGLAVFLLPRA